MIFRPVVADAVDVRVLHRRDEALGEALARPSKPEWIEAITQSRVASASSSMSRLPSARMSTSMPASTVIPGAVQGGDRLGLGFEPPVAQAPRVVADGDAVRRAPSPRAPSPRASRARPTSPCACAGRPAGRRARRAAGARRRARPRARPGSRAAPAGSRRSRGARRRPPRRPPGASPALDVEDAVLKDREAAADGVLAQGDVVVLRAREVLEQVPVALRRDDAQVEAEALGDDGRLRAPRATTSATHSRSAKKAVRQVDRSPWRSGRGPSSSRAPADAPGLGDTVGEAALDLRHGAADRRKRLAQKRAAGRRGPSAEPPATSAPSSSWRRARQAAQALLLGGRRRSSSDSTPSSDQSFRAVLGPRPGTCMTSTSPGGSLPAAWRARSCRPSRRPRRSCPRSWSRFPRAASPSVDRELGHRNR